MTRRFCTFAAALITIVTSLVAFTWAQAPAGGFEQFWGARYTYPSSGRRPLHQRLDGHDCHGRVRRLTRAPSDAMHHWNHIAIDSRGTRSHAGRRKAIRGSLASRSDLADRARAMAIVHIAIFDAVNAIAKRYRSYTNIADASPERRWTRPSHRRRTTRSSRCSPRRRRTATSCSRPSSPRSRTGRGQDRGHPCRPARRARDSRRSGPTTARSTHEPLLGTDFITSDRPGKWRQDPISQLPVALGAHWGEVTPFVVRDVTRFRVPPPPAMNSRAYTEAFNEVKRLGGDGVNDADQADRRSDECWHLLGVRRHAESLCPAAPLQPDCR